MKRSVEDAVAVLLHHADEIIDVMRRRYIGYAKPPAIAVGRASLTEVPDRRFGRLDEVDFEYPLQDSNL